MTGRAGVAGAASPGGSYSESESEAAQLNAAQCQ